MRIHNVLCFTSPASVLFTMVLPSFLSALMRANLLQLTLLTVNCISLSTLEWISVKQLQEDMSPDAIEKHIMPCPAPQPHLSYSWEACGATACHSHSFFYCSELVIGQQHRESRCAGLRAKSVIMAPVRLDRC